MTNENQFYTKEDIEEIDRTSRAYGFEVGKGRPLLAVFTNLSPDNPFLDKDWRTKIEEGYDVLQERPPSGLVAHARRELELLGEEEGAIEWYCKVIQAFADFGHSGGSAAATIPVLYDLLRYQNLTPLTDTPEDWIEVADGMWQNRRCSRAFSENGGRSYYLVDEEPRKMYIARRMYRGTPDKVDV